MRSAIIACLLLAGSLTTTFAQGGGGRSESVRIPTLSVDRPDRPSKRSFKPVRNTPPRIVLPATGSVTIRVNEGDSRLQIIRDNIPIETIDLPKSSTSLIIRTLEVGSYAIAAKKAGFHDEMRAVSVEKGESRTIGIDLRPKMATLSVASNVHDAKISIDGLGNFLRPVERALVEPGSYRVRISRRGYVSREVRVDLKTAGSEERLNLILEPLRVDAVLDLVFEHIRNTKFAEAEALVTDVLEFNPRHARANLAFGFVHLGRAETEKGVERILRAIGSGETFSLPVAIRVEPTDANSVAAAIRLDSRSFRLESSDRAGLNFSIKRADLGRPDREGNAIIISGHAEYHGRVISPRLQLYSPLFTTSCDNNLPRSCTSDAEFLRALFEKWRQ